MPDPTKKRAPVDTVALKKTIAKEKALADASDMAMVAADRGGRKRDGDAMQLELVRHRVAESRGKATLDSARQGKIRTLKGKRK